MKRNATLFTTLKNDGAWDSWQHSTLAQAHVQHVDDMLNPTYTPSTTDEKLLFDERQKYMYAVFEKTLLTDQGKTLVHDHQCKYDAQMI